MKVAVIGATGKTGELTWRGAMALGHEVTVFGRSVEQRYSEERVAKIQGDVLDAGAVAQALAGQQAVLVCLGPVGLKDRRTLSEGAANIVTAMKSHRVERIVFVSAAGVGESWKQIPFSSKLLFHTILKTLLAEHAREEEIIAQSGLIWTAVRAAVLTNKPEVGRVTASNTTRTTNIPRTNLAAFLVAQLTSDEYLNQAISVTAG